MVVLVVPEAGVGLESAAGRAGACRHRRWPHAQLCAWNKATLWHAGCCHAGAAMWVLPCRQAPAGAAVPCQLARTWQEQGVTQGMPGYACAPVFGWVRHAAAALPRDGSGPAPP